MTRGNAELVKVFLVAEGSAPHPGGKADFTLPATTETQALFGTIGQAAIQPDCPNVR